MLRHHELYSHLLSLFNIIPFNLTYMYFVLPTLPLLRRPSGPSDPTGSGSGGFNPALAWGLTAPCGSGACSGPRERKERERGKREREKREERKREERREKREKERREKREREKYMK